MNKPKEPVKMTDCLSQATLAVSDTPEVDQATIDRYKAFYRAKLIENGFDDRSEHNIEAISRYLANYYAGTTEKGLCLLGEPGRGKTFAFKIMSKLLYIKTFYASELVDMWELYGTKGRSELYTTMRGHRPIGLRADIARNYRDCIIDDIGTEPISNIFGVKREVIGDILLQRVREFEDSGTKTHLSSNSSMEELKNRYSPRIESRLNQICHIVTMNGTDRRKD